MANEANLWVGILGLASGLSVLLDGLSSLGGGHSEGRRGEALGGNGPSGDESAIHCGCEMYDVVDGKM